MYVKAVKSIEVQKLLDVEEDPEGLPPMQTFSPHILYHLSTYFGKEKLLQNERILQKTGGAENDGRDWLCTMLDHCLLLTVELLIFFWRGRQYHMKMLDKKCLLSVQWELRRWQGTTTVTCGFWPLWTEVAEKVVRRRCEGGDCEPVFKAGVLHYGHNCRRKGSSASFMDGFSTILLHSEHQWC